MKRVFVACCLVMTASLVSAAQLVFPGVGWIGGWTTDIYVAADLSETMTNYATVYYIPKRSDSSTYWTANVELTGGDSFVWFKIGNVLQALFGEKAASTSGTLVIRADFELIAWERISNASGQASAISPADELDPFTVYAMFGEPNDYEKRFRYNIFCTNLQPEDPAILLVNNEWRVLAPFSTILVEDLTGLTLFETWSINVFCTGSMIDNMSQDPVILPPVGRDSLELLSGGPCQVPDPWSAP